MKLTLFSKFLAMTAVIISIPWVYKFIYDNWVLAVPILSNGDGAHFLSVVTIGAFIMAFFIIVLDS